MELDIKENSYICRYCGRICKNANSLRNHERLCHLNPNRQISYGNKGNMPKHIKAYYHNNIIVGGDVLNITREQLDNYRKEHPTCEICGRTIEESVKWDSDHAPKKLCIDHDHNKKIFRGLLCSCCNRQLGWYEKNKDSINEYLNKSGALV